MNNEEKLIAMKGFTDQMEKEAAAGFFAKAKSVGRAFKSGWKNDVLKTTKGNKNNVVTGLHKNRERAYSVGRHLSKNKLPYAVGGTAVTAGGTGYALGS